MRFLQPFKLPGRGIFKENVTGISKEKVVRSTEPWESLKVGYCLRVNLSIRQILNYKLAGLSRTVSYELMYYSMLAFR